MHELHAADKILNQTIEFGKQKKLIKIIRILIYLGTVIEHGEEINPRYLRYNFENLSKGTIAEDAKLDIKKIKGDFIEIKEISGE